jgi:hypothetical protein
VRVVAHDGTTDPADAKLLAEAYADDPKWNRPGHWLRRALPRGRESDPLELLESRRNIRGCSFADFVSVAPTQATADAEKLIAKLNRVNNEGDRSKFILHRWTNLP